MELNKIRNEVNNMIGFMVSTIYGDSLVVGIVKEDDGKEYIHLKEFGVEDYYVELNQWKDLVY